MNLYIADTHFGHGNIIRMDHRPFSDAEEMDEYLIARWNDRVHKDDDVYMLGDFCYKSGNKQPQDYLKRLKGKKHLIVGNHDSALMKNEYAKSFFEDIHELSIINDNQNMIVLCHYPLAEWPGFFRNAYHIYGHIHNNKNDSYQFMQKYDRALNAGCMINNYTPVSLRELIENNQRFKSESNIFRH